MAYPIRTLDREIRSYEIHDGRIFDFRAAFAAIQFTVGQRDSKRSMIDRQQKNPPETATLSSFFPLLLVRRKCLAKLFVSLGYLWYKVMYTKKDDLLFVVKFLVFEIFTRVRLFSLLSFRIVPQSPVLCTFVSSKDHRYWPIRWRNINVPSIGCDMFSL